MFGDDVDDAINGVGSPDGSAGATDDLNAVDIFEHDVVDGPQDTTEQWGIDAAAVDEDEDVAGELVSQAADANCPIAGTIDAEDVYAGNESESVRNAGDARAADVIGSKDVDGCRGVPDPCGLFGLGGDFEVAKLFKRKRLKSLSLLIRRLSSGREDAGRQDETQQGYA